MMHPSMCNGLIMNKRTSSTSKGTRGKGTNKTTRTINSKTRGHDMTTHKAANQEDITKEWYVVHVESLITMLIAAGLLRKGVALDVEPSTPGKGLPFSTNGN